MSDLTTYPYSYPQAAQAFRRRCERLVRQLPIPAPFDEHQFCAALGAERGRPIALRPWPLRQRTTGDDIITGFIGVAPDRDVIFYERDTRRIHQQQIIAHEGAHLILGHQGESITPDDLEDQLHELAPATRIRHVHRRAGTQTPEEFEAETLGRLILLHAYSDSARLANSHPHAARLLALLDGLEGDNG
jgi:hypothetical protein